MRLREGLVCLKVPVSDDQLITPRTTIRCQFGCGTMSFPAYRKADPANWLLPFGTVNRESEFTHMRSGPVGCHNIMHWLESLCDRRIIAARWKALHLFLLCLYRTENLLLNFDFPSLICFLNQDANFNTKSYCWNKMLYLKKT